MIGSVLPRRYAGFAAAASALVLALAAPAAVAQGTPPQTAAATPGGQTENVPVPKEIVANALTKSREALRLVNQYLTGGGENSPEEVTRRATLLINALAEQRGAAKAEELLLAIDRVTALTSRSLARADVIQLGIDGGYRPAKGTIALDFGLPDAAAQPGFERVAPGDSRVTGKNVGGLRRPAENNLLADGLSGVEKIKIKVQPGQYRVVLMTQNLGESKFSNNPFGRQIKVNGVPVLVGNASPDRWRSQAMLSNRGAALVSGKAAGGFFTGDISSESKPLFARQQGGAIVIEANADTSEIEVEFIGFDEGAAPYLTGMLVEPIDRTSDLVLSPEARKTLVPLNVRLALESQVVAAAATVIEQVAPNAGALPRSNDLELPEPEFETADVVSRSN